MATTKENCYIYNRDLRYNPAIHKIVGETSDLIICQHLNTDGVPIYRTCFRKLNLPTEYAELEKYRLKN